MDATAAKAGLFSFLSRHPPTGTGGFETAAKMLRYTGFVLLVGGVISLVINVWWYVTVMGDSVYGAAYTGGAMFGMLIGLAFLAAGLWWVNFTYNHWCSRDIRGYKHALIIGILLVVFGGWGAFSLLGAMALMATLGAVFGVVYTLYVFVPALVSAAYLIVGIMILVNRNKPDAKAAFGQTAQPGYAPHT